MYFPYLRGKQFELIALREICSFVDHKNLISPIIEPVKESTVTLEKTLDCLKAGNINFNFIINPKVGDIKRDSLILSILNDKLNGYTNYQPTIIVDNKTDITKVSFFVTKEKLENLTIICNSIPKKMETFFDFIDSSSIKYIVLNDKINSKRFTREIKKKGIATISLTDSFNSAKRNVDYQNNDDEFFSDEHLFFKDENNIGFSDFVTIGEDYVDSGFLPYAVAIHLTYLNAEDEFWVRHFVSNSNEDTTDVAGKFGEALRKLIAFIDEKKLNTEACKVFRELANKGSYSGLGSIKKLSVMHHIELVYNYLKA